MTLSTTATEHGCQLLCANSHPTTQWNTSKIYICCSALHICSAVVGTNAVQVSATSTEHGCQQLSVACCMYVERIDVAFKKCDALAVHNTCMLD